MLNWRPKDADMYEDVQTRWQYENTNTDKPPQQRLERLWRSSRDSARTPVQWSAEANAGFTTGAPWFYVNENYQKINVADQEQDPDSLLNFYREAIALRKQLKVVRFGSYKEYFPMDSKQYVYVREMEGQKILVVCSFSEEPVRMKVPKTCDLRRAKLVLHNYKGIADGMLRPYEARVYLWE